MIPAAQPPYRIIPAQASAIPLILSSPHSGRHYPPDFHFIAPLPLLRQAEDAYVDELIARAPEFGATLLLADFPRSYIDVNRAETDLDPALFASAWPTPLKPSTRTLQGLGLVRRLCKSDVPMYAAPLAPETVQQRLTDCYHPYHRALTSLLDAQIKKFNKAYLLDCHSMPSFDSARARAAQAKSRRPDFVIGTRDGASCEPEFAQAIKTILINMGYSVALNDPYKGMEILARHGKPKQGRHAAQLEINRALYIEEPTLIKLETFYELARDLTLLFQALADFVRDSHRETASAAE